jgi:hypothetical protein
VVTAPAPDAIAPDAESPLTIAYDAADPDGDALTVKLEAVRGGEAVLIAEGLPGGAQTFAWDTTGVAAAASWRIRATVSDGKATRVGLSGAFIVSHETTADRHADLRPILARCANCHPSVVAVDLDAASIRAAWRGPMYRRVVQKREMPPPSAEALHGVTLAEDERARFGRWLLAGAPE